MLGFAEVLEMAYEELTLEFLSTVEYNREEGEVHFQLWGQNQTVSLSKFNYLLGVPDVDEKAVCAKEKPYSEASFWGMISSGSSNPKKGDTIIAHKFRLIHQFLAGTLMGRTSRAKVNQKELFLMWCMHNQKKINVGHYFLEHCEELCNKNSGGAIFISMYITKIAKALYPDFNPEDFDTVPSEEPITETSLSQLHICAKEGDNLVLLPEKVKPLKKKLPPKPASVPPRTYPTRGKTSAKKPTSFYTPVIEDLTISDEERKRRLKSIACSTFENMGLMFYQMQMDLEDLKAKYVSQQQTINELQAAIGLSTMGTAVESQGPEPKKRKQAVKPVIEEVADTEGEDEEIESPESEHPENEEEDDEMETPKAGKGEGSHSSQSPSY